MRAQEIKDKKTLRAWMEGRPQTEIVAIAHRVALRVLPLWAGDMGRDWAVKRRGTGLRICRNVLISGVFTGFPEVDINKAVAAFAFAFSFDARADADAAADVIDAADAADIFLEMSRRTTWSLIRQDAEALVGGQDIRALPLWPDGLPDEMAQAEARAFAIWDKDPATWDFWARWYRAARDGAPLDWALQRDIALIADEDWNQGPEHVAALIRDIETLHRAAGLPMATPVEFTFDQLAKIMRMIGIDDDTAHLREPKIVQRFVDDCAELRDKLQDFVDYAAALSGGGNHAGVLRIAAEKVLAELQRTADHTHIRARRVVGLGAELEMFGKDGRARDDLGQNLSKVLDGATDLLKTVTRRHFGPAYTALAPLAGMRLEHLDQDAVVALLDDVIAFLEQVPRTGLVPLDADGMSVFKDMVREAHDYRAAMAEASSDEFRAALNARFAESVAGTGLSFGRFLERSAAAAGHADRATAAAVKRYKRAKTLAEIFELIRDFMLGGTPSV